jgi:hypothetical protein
MQFFGCACYFHSRPPVKQLPLIDENLSYRGPDPMVVTSSSRAIDLYTFYTDMKTLIFGIFCRVQPHSSAGLIDDVYETLRKGERKLYAKNTINCQRVRISMTNRPKCGSGTDMHTARRIGTTTRCTYGWHHVMLYWFYGRLERRASSVERQASSVKHQASSVKRRLG